MSIPPLRFVHAARLLLDVPLESPGRLGEHERRLVADASFAAFENVIAACVEHEVDFLLLTGETFVERDRSLPARAALCAGFRRLHRAGVRICVVPGTADPPAAWAAIPDLPENVVVLGEFSPISADNSSPIPRHEATRGWGEKDAAGTTSPPFGVFLSCSGGPPVVVTREGRSVAEIVFADPHVADLPDAAIGAPPRPDVFTIGVLQPASESRTEKPGFSEKAGLLEPEPASPKPAPNDPPVHYLALPGEERRTVSLTHGIGHCAGGTVGLARDASGPRGCTLVEVAADGTTRCRFVPTATVRRESFELELDSAAVAPGVGEHSTESADAGSVRHFGTDCQSDLYGEVRLEELARRMHEHLTRIRRETTEQLWLINWTLPHALDDDPVRDRLLELLGAPPRSQAQPGNEGEPLSVVHRIHCTAEKPAREGLFADFCRFLEDDRRSFRELLGEVVDDPTDEEPGWPRRLKTLIRGLDEPSVHARARRLGHRLLGENNEDC